MKRWYVVHAYSGFEKSVAQALRDRIVRDEMQEKFGDVLVPTEEVVEMRDGQKRRRVRDNVLAGVVGGVMILAVVGGQIAYHTVGPGVPEPTPTETSQPAPPLLPEDPDEPTEPADPEPDTAP